jgi:hypothetical protein
MPRRRAAITQADVARAIRAAKQAGATGVEVKPDGTLLIRLVESSPALPADGQADTSLEAYKDVAL